MDDARYQEALKWVTTWLESRNPSVAVRPDTRFYMDGIVDSFAIVELIGDAEEHFGVVFSSEELASPAFQSVSGMAHTIARPGLAA